uniref:Secreted protein n=1 Tax=Arundo donax TaxID=35708 RepID=A0A0A8YIF7_ARUDO
MHFLFGCIFSAQMILSVPFLFCPACRNSNMTSLRNEGLITFPLIVMCIPTLHDQALFSSSITTDFFNKRCFRRSRIEKSRMCKNLSSFLYCCSAYKTRRPVEPVSKRSYEIIEKIGAGNPPTDTKSY